MKLFLSSILFMVLFSSQSHADQYMLMMSKNDQVCQDMLDLINNDISTIGKIDYAKHEEFSGINWQEISNKTVNPKAPANFYCYFYESAVFDINNDTINDCVIRKTACLRSVPSHNIYVYDCEQNEDSGLIINKDLPVKFKFDKTGSSYRLKDAEKVTLKGQFAGKQVRPSIGGMFVLNPFKYHNEIFLSITTLSSDPSPLSGWHIISKVDDDFQINDQCYFSLKKSK